MIGSVRGTLLERWSTGEVLVEVFEALLQDAHDAASPPSSSTASTSGSLNAT